MVGRQLRAVHVGRGEIVWQDRCDAANGSKEPILPNAAPHTFRSDELNAGISDGKDGPLPTFTKIDLTAARHTKSGHSYTLQHFRPRRSASRTKRLFKAQFFNEGSRCQKII